MKYTYIKNVGIVVITLVFMYLGYILNDANKGMDKVMDDITKLQERNKAMEDSIKVLNAVNQTYVMEISQHKSNLDSVTKVKNKVIVKYRDQKNFVNDADIHQLDSVIRSNTTIGF